MRDDERNLLLLCKPEVTLQGDFSGNRTFYVAERCVDLGWLEHVRDDQEIIAGPGQPQVKLEQSVYRITQAGADALASI